MANKTFGDLDDATTFGLTDQIPIWQGGASKRATGLELRRGLGLGVNVVDYGADPTGTIDSTFAFYAAIEAVYAQTAGTLGGGEVFIPAGKYLVSTLTKAFTATRSVSLRGAGNVATVLQKTGAGTDPIINFSGSNLGDLAYFHFSDFTIIGNAKAHDGIKLTLASRFTLSRLSIFACDTALNNLGSLIYTVQDCTFVANNIGYKGRQNSAIDCNLIQFIGGGMNANTTFAMDIGNSDGMHLYGVDFESNGTTGNTATGAIVIRSSCFGQISFNGCWFEANLGMCMRAEAATALNLSFLNVHTDSSENLADIAGIKQLLLNNFNALGASDNFVNAALKTVIVGGGIYTYTDNSPASTTVGLATSANVGGFRTGAISAVGAIADIGQVGTFGFLSSGSGLVNLGAYNYDASKIEPLKLFCSHVQFPTATSTALNSVSNVINTDPGKVAGAMVFNTTVNKPVYAVGTDDNSLWVDGAGATVNTPV
jgi:hypothetical protein